MKSMQRNIEATLMLWPEDSLVNRSVMPDSKRDKKTPAFYGRQCIELYKNVGRVVAENVLGLISNADGVVFEQVCFDLESEGYEVQPFIVPAAGKDSFQERKRVWVVACLNSFGSKKDKVTSGEHFKAFRQTKKQLPDCTHFESWVQSLRYYSGLDGVVYGIPNWMDRTHALGNAIDPRVAYEFLITIDYLLA